MVRRITFFNNRSREFSRRFFQSDDKMTQYEGRQMFAEYLNFIQLSRRLASPWNEVLMMCWFCLQPVQHIPTLITITAFVFPCPVGTNLRHLNYSALTVIPREQVLRYITVHTSGVCQIIFEYCFQIFVMQYLTFNCILFQQSV